MPYTAYEQSAMPTKDGSTPMLDKEGRLSKIIYTPNIVAKTAAYSVLPSESGTIFTTVGATQAITFTLPAISTGPWAFTFINGVNYGMTVAAATADTILTFNDAAADSIAFSTSDELIGGVVEVFCDGTTLFAFARLGVEAQTPTIAT